MGNAIGGAEQHGNLGEVGAADGEGCVLGCPPVELEERGATEVGDGGVDCGLELREGGLEWVIGLAAVDVVVAGPKKRSELSR